MEKSSSQTAVEVLLIRKLVRQTTMATSVASVIVACILATHCGGFADEILVNAPPASLTDPLPPLPAGEGESPKSHLIHRRATACGSVSGLTDAQKTEVVNVHNQCRSQEPAAGLLQMGWDDNLAAQAQAWTQQCLWQHGMITDCDGNSVGQNLFMVYGSASFPPANMTQAITAWNNERQYWNFTSGSCQSGQVCGHWTQVVWDDSSLVGCGYTLCPTVTMSTGTVKNAVIVACDYSPPGNYVGELMYVPGTACSACSSITRKRTTNRGYKCINALCVPCSPASDQSCQCGPPDACLNGGTWSNVDCSCKCASGFFGATCEIACADVQLTANCQYWAGLGYCSSTSIYYSFMKANCVKTCSLCG